MGAGIKLDLTEISWGGGGVGWIRLAQVRYGWGAVVNAVMNLRVLAARSQSVSQRYATNRQAGLR
jgi:hypothetical protein